LSGRLDRGGRRRPASSRACLRRSGRSRLGRRARCGGGFRRGRRFRRSRFLGLNTAFPRRTGIHVGGKSFAFPFLLEIRRRLVRSFSPPYYIIPRIGLGTDPTAFIGAHEIERNWIPAVRAQIDMHVADIFQQATHSLSKKKRHDATTGYAQARERTACHSEQMKVARCFLDYEAAAEV
jgi:hypothetical protein